MDYITSQDCHAQLTTSSTRQEYQIDDAVVGNYIEIMKERCHDNDKQDNSY